MYFLLILFYKLLKFKFYNHTGGPATQGIYTLLIIDKFPVEFSLLMLLLHLSLETTNRFFIHQRSLFPILLALSLFYGDALTILMLPFFTLILFYHEY